jgi:hypothetical protein
MGANLVSRVARPFLVLASDDTRLTGRNAEPVNAPSNLSGMSLLAQMRRFDPASAASSLSR